MNEVVTTDSPSVAPNLTWAEVEALPIPAAPAPAGPSPIAFSGARPVFRRLVMRGALLELVTLGFYRFWLATDMRRHLWSNTSVDGDALEYTGTAKELLIGFLFALAILVPVYLVYFFIGLEAERLQAFASVPLVLLFYLFAKFANYRARRYRLSRTVWRGVRFWMRGSGWAFAWRAGLWALLSIMTFGLTLPAAKAALERYKMRHSFYGSLPGRFEGTGWMLFKRFWWLWFATVLIIAMMVMTPVPMPIGAVLLKYTPITATLLPLVPALLAVVLLVGWPFAFAAYKVAEWRWWVAGIRFGDVRFESRLRLSAFNGLYWKVIGWSVLILVFLSAWIGGVIGGAVVSTRSLEMSAEQIAAIMQTPWVLASMAIGYLTAAMAFGTVIRMYLRRDLWARVTSSALVHNLAAVESVTAQGQAASALGEGLANSLDIGGF